MHVSKLMTKNNLTQKSLKISSLLCLMASLFPVLYITGWILKVPILLNPLPKFSSMNQLTAMGLIIGAHALYLKIALKKSEGIIVAMSFVIIAIGLMSLSFQLQLLGFSIIILALPEAPIKIGQLFALLYGGISLISITAFLFHANRFYSYAVKSNDLQVNAAFSYACLMLAYLFGTSSQGYCKILASATHSGKIARKIFWTIVVLPPLLGITTRVGVELRWYDSSTQASMFVSIFTILLLRIVWKITKNSEYEEQQMIVAKEQLSNLLKKVTDSEKKFRGLLENATDAVLIINKKGNIIFINKQLTSWFQYESEELINQPVEILMPVRFRDIQFHLTQEYLLNPLPMQMGRNIEIFGLRKDGSEFPLDIALSPFDTPEGMLITAVIRDMSFEKKKEARNRYILNVSKIL
jgi:PAS domain S-box-containing protein